MPIKRVDIDRLNVIIIKRVLENVQAGMMPKDALEAVYRRLKKERPEILAAYINQEF